MTNPINIKNKIPRLLVVGTVDTKSDEIFFLVEQVILAGAQAVVMDVSVLGSHNAKVAISNQQVALASGMPLEKIIALGDENLAMTQMAKGACHLAQQLFEQDQIDGMLALGGTMGTDLALDVALSLPLGVPKVLLSTIAFSPLIAPERLAPDLTMMLWAGGLYGLNSLCKQSLSQAAWAAVGACRSDFCTKRQSSAEELALVENGQILKPMVGMTSLGSSALKYMVKLKPALEQRGFELAVFHTTGMGGRAFEELAAKGKFACVMDFSLQELVNHLGSSVVTAGPSRMTAASKALVPQLIAPGATDMVDYPAWAHKPIRFQDRPSHAHNRLIASVCIDAEMRSEVALAIIENVKVTQSPIHLIIPTHGIEEWDRQGQALCDPEGLETFIQSFEQSNLSAEKISFLDAHINDEKFVDQVLNIFDEWLAKGLIKTSSPVSKQLDPLPLQVSA